MDNENWRSAVLNFAKAIQHGDDEHRQWLMNAAGCFVAGMPLPPVTGSGAIDRITRLRRIEKAARAYYNPDRRSRRHSQRGAYGLRTGELQSERASPEAEGRSMTLSLTSEDRG